MDNPQRPAPDAKTLRQFYVGKDINKVPTPAVALDRAKFKRHCKSLLHACDTLGVGFRAHIKTHKTLQGARLQAGETSKKVNLVASSIPEIELLLPLVEDFRAHGRETNILYGIPLPASQVSRLAALARRADPGSISVLIDHPDQLAHIARFYQEAQSPLGVYLKVDTGYHRAGLPPSGINKGGIIPELMKMEESGSAHFIGLYSHSSLSYNDSTPQKAMENLEDEIQGCLDALQHSAQYFPAGKQINISVGASPQVASVENLVDATGTLSESAESLRNTIRKVNNDNPHGYQTSLELHAGVYATLDVQQLSTRSRVALGSYEDEIAISVMAEVCSVYNNGERAQPEALLAAGVLALGREPCAAYKGWGVVHKSSHASKSDDDRLIVSRISQEHAIVSWEDPVSEGNSKTIPFEVGQVVRVFPNHACVAGALYGWYLVVDSDDAEEPTKIKDVWVRTSGW